MHMNRGTPARVVASRYKSRHAAQGRPQSVTRRLGAEALILGGYLLLTLLFTYPLVTQMGTHVVGLANDFEEYVWRYWWVRKALLELHTNPFFSTWLYYPQ